MMYGFDYISKGIPFIRIDNLNNPIISNSNLVYINEDVNKAFSSTQLKYNDILMGVRGNTIGRLGVYKGEDFKANISPNLIYFRLAQKSMCDYISIFLCSKYGIGQIRRITTGTGQPTITSILLKKIKILLFTQKFREQIIKVVRQARLNLSKSNNLYQQAEEFLLSELGLKDWQPTEENIAVKSFAESFGKSDRLDAEHYQPKFDQLIQKLEEKVKLTKLGKLLTCNQRGKQPSYLNEDENNFLGLPVVNSKHVREGQVIVKDNRYAEYPNSNNPLIIQIDDVLINGTGVGTIGRCAPYLYQQDALPDNHVTILRSDSLDSIYLSIFINSIIGQYQVEKYLKGSSGQIELYPKDIAEFWIWEAPDSIQQSIRDKVEESHHKREQSKQLLEIAKTGVEKAIEENESRATAWINQQLAKLNIDLSETIKKNESN